MEIVIVHGAFVLLFTAAAFLFQYAGREGPRLAAPDMTESQEESVG
jgi:hypothetical protein